MLSNSLNQQIKNVNSIFSTGQSFVGVPKNMRKDFTEKTYHVEYNEAGKRKVVSSIAPINQKKQDNLTVSRILKSLYVENPAGLSFDKSLLDDAEKIKKCGTTQYVLINGEVKPTVHTTCGKRTCPHCTWRASKTFAKEMEQILDLALCKKEDKFAMGREGYAEKAKRVHGDYYTGKNRPNMGFLTLTVPNCKPEDLSRTITHMMKAWNDITRSYEFTEHIDGGMRALEVTFNPDTMTMHPHFHILLVGKQRKNLKKWFTMSGLATQSKNNYVAEKAWRERWQNALHNVGHFVDISYKSINCQYITKGVDYGDEAQRKTFCYEKSQEIGKYVWKYSDILSLAKSTYQNIKYDTGVYDDGTRFKEARGEFGEEKPDDVYKADWQKVKTAFWHTMTGLHRRQAQAYFGCLADIRRQLREEREEIADSGRMEESEKDKTQRTRLVRLQDTSIFVDADGRQVWNKEEAVETLYIHKQDKPVHALKLFKNKPNEETGEREPFYLVISPEFDATDSKGRKKHILHNIQYIATILNLSFDKNKEEKQKDARFKVSSYESVNDPLTLMKILSPKAFAQTEEGQHFYKVILPYYRKLACDNKEGWRYLEKEDRKQNHVISGYSDVDEYFIDPEIPF